MPDERSLSDPPERNLREWARDVDTVFDLLAHSCRRHVLTTLLEAGEPCDIDELVDAVVARDPSLTAADSKQIRVSLHHVHLPKLAAADVVEYEAGVVRPVDFSLVEAVMEDTGLYDP